MGKTVKIYFRADGNDRIGHGHVIRTLAVVGMLRNSFECIFIIQQPYEWLLKEIREVCHDCITLPTPKSSDDEADYISSVILTRDDFIILDGYHFIADYQQRILKSGCKMVCIDDLHKFHFLADVVINHAGGVKIEDYSVEAFTRIALGPEYAMLRGPFREAIKNIKVVSSINSVFICFGGADIHHIAARIVELCLQIQKIKEIHVVSSDSLINTLSKGIKADGKKLLVYKNLSAEEMVYTMKRCQLAICPSSSLAYEACTIGIGLITGIHADNQMTISRYLESSGCAISVGDFRIIEDRAIFELIAGFNEQKANEQVQNQRMVFKNSDNSFHRIFQKLEKESEIVIRRASGDDMLTYFNWATDPIVRQNSINANEFPIERHIEWFSERLFSQTSILYIFEEKNIPIAQLRFELEDELYVINYSIDKNYRGKGLSDVIIKMGIKQLSKEIEKKPMLKAVVRSNNIASSKAFINNSFTLRKVEKINDVSYEIYIK